MRAFGGCSFGASIICGINESGITCRNGLPVAPSSIRMLGRFQKLKSIEHEGLCRYVDLVRCSLAPNSVLIVSEYYTSALSTTFRDARLSDEHILSLSFQIVKALSHLHSDFIPAGKLTLDSICVIDDGKMTVRLSQYGISFLTNASCDSVVPCDAFAHVISPEQVVSLEMRSSLLPDSLKMDIWYFGLLLFQLFTGVCIADIWSARQFAAVIRNNLNNESGSLCDVLLRAVNRATSKMVSWSNEMHELVSRCLSIRPALRPNSDELCVFFSNRVHGVDPVPSVHSLQDFENDIKNEGHWSFSLLTTDEAYYLWKLCGSTPESILIKTGIIHLQNPVTTVPRVLIGDFFLFGNEDSRRFYVNNNIITLPMKHLLDKLHQLSEDSVIHSIELDGLPPSHKELSVIVKEKDFTYQLTRLILVRHLAESAILTSEIFRKAVSDDVPPVLRSLVWSALLNIHDRDLIEFCDLDTLAPHTSDRQLDVDIPRCHQYEELLTSPSAHLKLRRLLKSWMLTHPQYVYWQGCDSLAAPFLILNFNRLPIALASLTAFISKYLHNFFLKDNSKVIQEYLAVFNHLLAYVDPLLYSKMASLDFYPELYAIPWFLTCFAHVLPLHKLFHVWDILLLKDSSFPLFIGLSILKQLREHLINGSFNDVILIFSDLPDLSMERVIADSRTLYDYVPPSCTYRSESNNYIDRSAPEPRNFQHSIEALGVTEMKEWSCPRMSIEEFSWRVERQLIAVVDTRCQLEYSRSCVIRSVNYSDIADSSLFNISELLKAAQRNCHPICILGKDVEDLKKFTRFLIDKGVEGVCVLSGGYDSLKGKHSIVSVS